MKKSKMSTGLLIALAIASVAVSTSANAAGLDAMILGASNLISSLARMLNIAAALVGGYFVISGVMAWKKSANEHGGQQVEFKSVVVPIIAGACLVAFTGFVAMTSTTFGFATANTAMFG